MKKIVPFTEKEIELITAFEKLFKKNEDSSLYRVYSKNKQAVIALTESISFYPSIFSEQHIGNLSRSVSTLVDKLCADDAMHVTLNIPTKAFLGKGFAIAKMNLLFLIYYMCEEMKGVKDLEKGLIDAVTDIVFTLMAEEVFISIISDENASQTARHRAGYKLADIWERRIDHGIKEFVPLLASLWRARKMIKPAFGTLTGISEILSLSARCDPDILEFFDRLDASEDEINSLLEFLMGLSYEEIAALHRIKDDLGISSIGENEITELLGHEKTYPDYNSDDPRDMYKSFIHRKNNAIHRTRTREHGPKKTVEEYIITELLSRSDTDSSDLL